MITVEGLSKSYSGTTFAVRDVSFQVNKGEVVGFLGPNGAGKSTTLRVVAGFLGPPRAVTPRRSRSRRRAHPSSRVGRIHAGSGPPLSRAAGP